MPVVALLAVVLVAGSVLAVPGWNPFRSHGTGVVTVPGTGTQAVYNVAAFTDPGCTQPLGSLDFSCTATNSTGAFSVSKTIYIQNTSTPGTGNYSSQTAIIGTLPITFTDSAGLPITPVFSLVITPAFGVAGVVGTETPGTSPSISPIIPGNAEAITLTLTGTVTANTSPTTPSAITLPDFYVNFAPGS